ncbi:MAG: hypothetical protein J2P48_07595 [Alphaproteobacteria bacterium]|nr:hypothetical protein [Alphaproteobacteria bacterium]
MNRFPDPADTIVDFLVMVHDAMEVMSHQGWHRNGERSSKFVVPRVLPAAPVKWFGDKHGLTSEESIGWILHLEGMPEPMAARFLRLIDMAKAGAAQHNTDIRDFLEEYFRGMDLDGPMGRA